MTLTEEGESLTGTLESIILLCQATKYVTLFKKIAKYTGRLVFSVLSLSYVFLSYNILFLNFKNRIMLPGL